MFYNKISFSKKAIFLEKTAKNPFVGGHDCFEGMGRLATNLFYHKSGNGCFIIKQVFRKKQYFWRKLRRTYLWEGMTVLRGGAPGDKNQYNLFCRPRCFEYFSFNNFFEKNNIFQNKSEKLFLGGVTIFEGTGGRTTKMYITFFWGNEVPNTVLKFFSRNTLYRLT